MSVSPRRNANFGYVGVVLDAKKATKHVSEPTKSSKKMQVTAPMARFFEKSQKQAFRIVKRIHPINVTRTPLPNFEAQNASLETLLGLMPGTKMKSLRL